MLVQFVCLANSKKLTGRCVAGIRMDGHGWIRPVGTNPDGTLFSSDYMLAGQREPALLDVIEVEIEQAKPKPYQPENWLLSDKRWRLVDELDTSTAAEFLQGYLDDGPELFGNRGDRILIEGLKESPLSQSLTVIEPTSAQWEITRSYRGNRQTRIQFKLQRAYYDISVTDPHWEQRLLPLEEGIYTCDQVGITDSDRLFLTISLGEPFGDSCYKLAAAVLLLSK